MADSSAAGLAIGAAALEHVVFPALYAGLCDDYDKAMWSVDAQEAASLFAELKAQGTPAKSTAVGGAANKSLVYGEIIESSIADHVMPMLGLRSNDVFYDLGSGTGKIPLQVALAAASVPGVAPGSVVCKGVELASARHALAQAAYRRITEETPEQLAARLLPHVEACRQQAAAQVGAASAAALAAGSSSVAAAASPARAASPAKSRRRAVSGSARGVATPSTRSADGAASTLHRGAGPLPAFPPHLSSAEVARALAAELRAVGPRVVAVGGSFLTQDITDATVIFINNTVFEAGLMLQLLAVLASLPRLRTLVVLRKLCYRHSERCAVKAEACAAFAHPPVEGICHPSWNGETTLFTYTKTRTLPLAYSHPATFGAAAAGCGSSAAAAGAGGRVSPVRVRASSAAAAGTPTTVPRASRSGRSDGMEVDVAAAAEAAAASASAGGASYGRVPAQAEAGADDEEGGSAGGLGRGLPPSSRRGRRGGAAAAAAAAGGGRSGIATARLLSAAMAAAADVEVLGEAPAALASAPATSSSAFAAASPSRGARDAGVRSSSSSSSAAAAAVASTPVTGSKRKPAVWAASTGRGDGGKVVAAHQELGGSAAAAAGAGVPSHCLAGAAAPGTASSRYISDLPSSPSNAPPPLTSPSKRRRRNTRPAGELEAAVAGALAEEQAGEGLPSDALICRDLSAELLESELQAAATASGATAARQTAPAPARQVASAVPSTAATAACAGGGDSDLDGSADDDAEDDVEVAEEGAAMQGPAASPPSPRSPTGPDARTPTPAAATMQGSGSDAEEVDEASSVSRGVAGMAVGRGRGPAAAAAGAGLDAPPAVGSRTPGRWKAAPGTPARPPSGRKVARNVTPSGPASLAMARMLSTPSSGSDSSSEDEAEGMRPVDSAASASAAGGSTRAVPSAATAGVKLHGGSAAALAGPRGFASPPRPMRSIGGVVASGSAHSTASMHPFLAAVEAVAAAAAVSSGSCEATPPRAHLGGAAATPCGDVDAANACSSSNSAAVAGRQEAGVGATASRGRSIGGHVQFTPGRATDDDGYAAASSSSSSSSRGAGVHASVRGASGGPGSVARTLPHPQSPGFYDLKRSPKHPGMPQVIAMPLGSSARGLTAVAALAAQARKRDAHSPEHGPVAAADARTSAAGGASARDAASGSSRAGSSKAVFGSPMPSAAGAGSHRHAPAAAGELSLGGAGAGGGSTLRPEPVLGGAGAALSKPPSMLQEGVAGGAGADAAAGGDGDGHAAGGMQIAGPPVLTRQRSLNRRLALQ